MCVIGGSFDPNLVRFVTSGATPHHREHPQVVPDLGASHDVRREGNLNKKLRYALGWKPGSQRRYRTNSDAAFAICALNTHLLDMVSRTRPADDGRSKTA